MKREDLFEAMAQIDEKYLLESESKLRSFNWKWFILPASLTLAGAAAVGMLMLAGNQPNPIEPEPPIIIVPNEEDEEDIINAELPKVSLSFETGGMGVAAYYAYSIDDIVLDMPVSPYTASFKTLPVYKNMDFIDYAGLDLNPDVEKMQSLLLDTAYKFGMDVSSLIIEEIKDDYYDIVYSLEVEDENYRIEVNSQYTVTVHLNNEKVLPENINNQYHASYEDIKAYGEYCMQEYSFLYENMEEPTLVVHGGDYNIDLEQSYDSFVYDKAGSEAEQMLNYETKRVQFYGSENGKEIWLIRIYHSYVGEKLGDYPVISLEEAKALLLSGKYATNSPSPNLTEENILRVEMSYRVSTFEDYIIPYYIFYMVPEIASPAGERPTTIGWYYVPAIPEKYIEGDVWWRGHFN